MYTIPRKEMSQITYLPASAYFINFLKQWFSIPVLGTPCSAHFACLPYLTHLIELISSFVQFMALSPNKLIISIRCVK